MNIYHNLTNRVTKWIAIVLLYPAIVLGGSLADSPLSLKGSVPPNVMFALSVEFPTAITPAYQDASSYSAGSDYLGYFDKEKCYTYDNVNGWFVPAGWATAHVCAGQWSGNFLNWASMSGLDEFRYAMTGGHRYQDTSTLTVLERSYQTSQGSNFITKTFNGNGSTSWPNGTALTITNKGQGVGMLVAIAGSDTANCTSPSSTSPYCALSLQSDSGSIGSCSSWTGTGTTGSPFTCSTFGAWSHGQTFASVTPGTKSSASNIINATVGCTSPTYSSGAFSCNLNLTPGTLAGSCSSWAGSGASGSPFYCASFGTFGGTTFVTSTQAAQTSFTTPVTTTTTYNDTINAASCTAVAGTSMTCTLPSVTPHTATCTKTSGSGSSSSPYLCGSGTTWTFSGGESYVNSTMASAKTLIGTKYYKLPTNISYSTSVTANQTLYYTPSYTGSDTAGYYYYSTYNLAISGSATYNVRVKVCDTTIGQESNCKQIGSAWKPTGSIQDNGDQMRFGVTSYFNANDIDNAVLRSKLKYVAPQKYSSSGGTIANPNAEWSATDGTLVVDPDAADAATHTSYIGTATNTGVINYINKFGNTGHTYKTYDDIGKLYYESLKYLRGLSPTSDFYNGATAANSDGFPVITTWDDPVLYSCQKNYIIAMGDSHTWCDKRLPGGTYASTGSSTCNAYTDGNSHAHVQDTGSLAGDTGVNVTTSTNWVGTTEGLGNIATSLTGAGSSASYYMAGLAYWAASTDIRPDDALKPQTLGQQTVKSYVIDVNEAKDCGYQSQFWLAAKYGNPASYATPTTTGTAGAWLTTGNPWSGTTALPASACSSRPPTGYVSGGGSVTWPKDLLRAGDPLSMITSVKSAIASIQAQIGDESALAQSSGSLDTGTGAYIYRAVYNSGGWTGDVQALTIDTSGTIGTTPAWTGASKLPANASRTILTFNDGLLANGTTETTANSRTGVVFDPANFATNLSTGQQAALNKDEFGTVDNLGVDRVNYLRGSQVNEAPNGNDWRVRTSLLGDFINSNPTYVGAPPAGLPGASYRAYALAKANRTPMLYVGGNDGMLHGFDASYTINSSTGNPVVTSTSGTELVAYIPSAVYPRLSQLMSPNYSHKFYVDGTPVVSEACFGTSCASNADQVSDWKTLLVGGLNSGGQGYYALDITTPTTGTTSTSTNFSASNVLWEFTDKDDADLGFTFSKPIIRKMNNGRWAVIFGNGFNNTYADNHASTTGRAYLYIAYVDGPGAGNSWTLGTNYLKIALISPSETTTPVNPANGLSSVSGVDKDLNGTVDILYAGDRNGNVWKVDVSSTNPTQWAAGFGSATAPMPLFSANDGASPTSSPQQITTSIEIGRHPDGGYMVLFGTGSWIDVTDPLGPFKTDTFYGIWDKDDGSTRVTSRSSLQKQKVLTTVDATGAACSLSTSVPGTCFTVQSTCVPNYTTTASPSNVSDPMCPSDIAYPANTGQQLGFSFDLSGSGERTISDHPKITGGTVVFTTLQPSANPCTGNTVGMEYNLNWLTGGAPQTPVYALTNNTSGLITVPALLDSSGHALNVVISGHVTSGGASDNPITFNAKPPASTSNSCSPPSGTPAPPTAACEGTNCADFVSGWGFLMNQQGATAGGNRQCVLSCHPPELGGGMPSCEWKLKQGQFGRISWRQIIR